MLILICSQLCDEIDEHEKNSSDMIEEEKKKIPGKKTLTKQYNYLKFNFVLRHPCNIVKKKNFYEFCNIVHKLSILKFTEH